MAIKKTRAQIAPRGSAEAEKRTGRENKIIAQPRISARWLIAAVCGTLAVAAICAWGVLCVLFWQGSWQLLYHPAATVARTPSSVGLAFGPVAFATTEEGTPQLKGWWVPAEPGAAYSRFTVLLLHGEKGNLGDTIDASTRLHAVGVNVLAFDYRGYGQSQFVRPSESHWRQDAESAIQYLTLTRRADTSTIVLDGEGLGANLAIEVAAAHPELAGVIVESPLINPMNAIFNDARAKLVPARLLVRDRYDLNAAAKRSVVPALWFEANAQNMHTGFNDEPAAFREISSRKTLVWLNPQCNAGKDFMDALSRWLDEMPRR
jgi:uncharacterized protein